MAIARQPRVFEFYIVGFDTCLVQPLRVAGVEYPVIAGFARYVEHSNMSQVYKLVRRAFLQITRDERRAVRLRLEFNLQLRLILDWRIIMNGQASDAPWQIRPAVVNLLCRVDALNRRTGRLCGDDRFNELRFRICDFPTESPALRM